MLLADKNELFDFQCDVCHTSFSVIHIFYVLMLFEGLFYEITYIFGELHTGLLRTVYGRYPPPPILHTKLSGVGFTLINNETSIWSSKHSNHE